MVCSKRNAEKIELLRMEVEAARESLETSKAALDNALDGIQTNRSMRELDLEIVRKQAKLSKLEKELQDIKDRSAVSPGLAEAVLNPAPAESHLFPKTRKDSHGY